MEACQRREEWSEADRLPAVNAWLSEANEGKAQDATTEKITCFFLVFFLRSLFSGKFFV
jgi:hypothetical protein